MLSLNSSAMNQETVTAVMKAIKKRNTANFVRILDENPNFGIYGSIGYRCLPQSRREIRCVSLMQKLVVSEYDEALRYYMNKFGQNIPLGEINSAMHWTMNSRTSVEVARVMLEVALNKAPPFLPVSKIFIYALKKRLTDIAERAVQLPEFDANARCPLPVLGIWMGQHWDLPLHDAVSYHEVTVIELLFTRGARVDALAKFITPMMVARTWFIRLLFSCFAMAPTRTSLRILRTIVERRWVE